MSGAAVTAVTVWINARFIDRRVTGVERVAFELLNALANEHLDGAGCWSDGQTRYRFGLIAPRGSKSASPWPNLPLWRAGRLRGHAWEQLELPVLTRNQWLLSLCNTGPAFKRRHIVFLHDAQPFAIPGNFSWRFRTWYRALFRLLGRHAAAVLVNSRFTGAELCRHAGIAASKQKLCHLGSEHVHRQIPAADFLDRSGLGDTPFVLAVSSANPNKNFGAVVRALQSLGEAAPACVIVGQRAQRHFAGISLDESKIRHLGYVEDNELAALYRKAMCMVFPSIYEGFGLPPLEAMAAGCPVIVSNTSSMPEVAADAAEYCSPHDIETLALAIAAVGSCPARRAAMREAGQRRASLFSWTRSSRVLLEALVQAAA